MAVAEGLSTRCFSSMLWNSLVHGVKWLKRALEVISALCKFKRCKLSDVEEVLAGCKVLELYMLVLCSAFGSSRICSSNFDSEDTVFGLVKESVLCRTYTWFFCLQGINVSFPVVIGELTSAIQKHK